MPKRLSSRDVGTSPYRYHTATYSPATVSVNRRTNDTVFVASMKCSSKEIESVSRVLGRALIAAIRRPRGSIGLRSGDQAGHCMHCELFSAQDKHPQCEPTTVPESKAARLISGFPITSENYSKAVQQLKIRFGRKDLLVQIYVRDLLSLVMKNATAGRNSDLESLYDMLETKL
ncbi:uncharacterized protein TNCV_1506131 [Trichonephila clavipes]|nr:uncharacterized protein TNCV_1506131 [Trichonephila clavipes]